MPIRNPFARRPVLPDEHPQPAEHQDAHCGFERVVTVGTKASSLSACSSQSHDTGEYKMSGV